MNKILVASILIFSMICSPVMARPARLTVAKRLQRHAIHKLEIQSTLGNIPGTKLALFGWGKKEDETDDKTTDVDSGDQAQGATPDTLVEDELSTELVQIIPQGPLTATEPWQKPNYSNQVGALGHTDTTFDIPIGLKDRVAFWRDIYTRYSTSQGVMHDSLHINIVYQPVDFTALNRDTALNSRQKHHSRERLVNGYRKDIEERLRRLSKVTSAEGLTGEDLRVWKMFESVHDPDKFIAATKRGRVRFQLGQRDRFALGIYYSGRYIREMEKIFKSEGLPIELTRLPFVESSFNIYARSRVGASGIWQFMRRTARAYMMVNNSVDERNDPLKATRSSARLLRSNFMLLKSWPLALTGWNHGPNGIARIVKKTGTSDLAEIINMYSSRRFGFASENFYSCFLAALDVEQHANKYFGGAKWSIPLDHAEIKLPQPVPFEAVKVWFKDDADLAQLYNPHFSNQVRKGRANMPKGTMIRIPVAMKDIAERFVSGNLKLAEMKAEAKRTYEKIPVIPEGTPVAVISASLTPMVSPSPALVKEELGKEPEYGLIITPEKKVLKK